MQKLPVARHNNIVVQEIGKEILVYDLDTHKAFNLNETSSIIYQACNGKTDFRKLQSRHNFTDDIIYFALDELKKANLLEPESSIAYSSPFAGMSRREAIKKVGLGTMIALPLISSLIAPTAAHAQSNACLDGVSCGCNYSNTDTTSFSCTDLAFGDCGSPGCVCTAFADSTAFCVDQGDGTKICFGECGVTA